jgi:hypothetical protein
VRNWLHLRVLRQIGAAVTGGALAFETRMVHGGGRKRHGIQMARIAGAGSGYVRCGLGPRVGRRVRTVVAGRALATYANVVHRRRPERHEILVTSVALRGGWYVVCRLGQSSAAGKVAG